MHWYEEFYMYIKYGLLIMFLLSFLHLKNQPVYLSDLNLLVQVFICIFLLYRFNPFKKSKFTAFDKEVVFDSAVYLLLSSLLVKLLVIINKNANKINKINKMDNFNLVFLNNLDSEKYNKINNEIKKQKKNDDNIKNNIV